jgi:hypothetical protein
MIHPSKADWTAQTRVDIINIACIGRSHSINVVDSSCAQPVTRIIWASLASVFWFAVWIDYRDTFLLVC